MGLLMIVTLTCAPGAQRAEVRPEELPGAVEPAAPWERAVRGSYENRGIAKIEKVGNRWALTVLCSGTHTTYIDDTAIDLVRYAGGYVSARYRYVERTIENPKCFRAPCGPVTQRMIALDEVKKLDVTSEQARESARDCGAPPKNKGQG
jgi:hypothetical protein